MSTQSAAELLVASAHEYWSRVTEHPFLIAVARNRLEPDAFARWVAADYAFNLEYLRFGAGLLALAPDLDACRVLGNHLRVNQATVDVLIDTAGQAGVDLAIEPGPFTLGLSSYLRALLTQGYEVALIALYCAERVYIDAWSAIAPEADQKAAYWPLIEHLSTGDSRADMEAIEGLVNTAAAGGVTAEMRTTFEMVVRFELLFWSEVFAGVGGAW